MADDPDKPTYLIQSIQHETIQYNTINTIQYNTIQYTEVSELALRRVMQERSALQRT